MKKLHCLIALLGAIAIVSGCQTLVPSVPPSVTFNNPQPRWSWTGTWQGQSGSILNLVQQGNQWTASGVVSGTATLSGNRAIGEVTDGLTPRTFDLVMSDDGMYAKGSATISGMSLGVVLTRISGHPEALAADDSPAAFGSGPPVQSGGWLGLALQNLPDGIHVGALVVGVEPGSPAALADIRAGDILTHYDDSLTDSPGIEDARHFLDSIQKLPAGNSVELELTRSGYHETRYVTRGAPPALSRLSHGPSITNPPATGNSARPAMPIPSGHSGTVLTVDEYNAIKRDNAIVAKARFKAMGVLTLRGRVKHVSRLSIVLAGEDFGANSVRCDFNRVGGRIIPPPAAMQLHKDDLVTIRGRVGANYFTTSDLGHCEILDIIPAAQTPHATTRVPAPGMIAAAPRGATAPPAGYYQCYSLNVLVSSNYCDRGDLQLDGAGNYMTTTGSAGRYVFDAGSSVVSFIGGVLDGRQALADRIKDGTFRIRMRKGGEGLPSPKQGFGIYTYEHRPSGQRTKP